MKSMKQIFEDVNVNESQPDVYDIILTAAKTITYRLELAEGGRGYPGLESLYKKADALLSAIEKNQKQIRQAIGD